MITALAVFGCAAALAGCANVVSGQAVLGAHVVAPSQSGSPSSGEAVADFDLCALLDWQDLAYDRDGVGGFGPTADVDEEYDQSCSYTASKGSAKGVTQLLFSKKPTINVKKPTGSFQVDGVSVDIGAISEQGEVVGCVTVLEFAGGRLGVAVDDDRHTFGDPCTQTKDVARVLAKREP